MMLLFFVCFIFPHCIGLWNCIEERLMTDHDQKDQDLVESSEEERSGGSSVLDIRKYTHQIWLAGLGAFSKAEEEGGRFFDALLVTGRDLEYNTRSAEATVDEIR